MVEIVGAPKGLGEPIYYKLDALLADAMMGINGVKAVEIGEGCHASKLRGSQNNDALTKEGFVTNKSGGILGGISNGDVITCKVYFKPTPSIFLPQQTIDTRIVPKQCVQSELAVSVSEIVKMADQSFGGFLGIDVSQTADRALLQFAIDVFAEIFGELRAAIFPWCDTQHSQRIVARAVTNFFIVRHD